MRRLASFEDPVVARALCEVLYTANIDSDLREGPDREVSVWVVAESDMARAQGILEAFVSRPHAQELAVAQSVAEARRASARPREQPPRPSAPPPHGRKPLRQRMAESPITFGLIGVCIGVALVTGLGSRADLLSHLSIASFERTDGVVRWYGYRDLLQGEVWRLITPIFIHFGPFHLLFNAFWLSDLGSPSERFQGKLRYVWFIVWSAVVSNLAQLVFGHSPTFGGMSGVVYSLAGYLWARGRTDPGSGIHMPGQLIGFFVGWMALGFSGILDDYVGPMANYAHLGGFAAGIAYGCVGGMIGRARPRRAG